MSYDIRFDQEDDYVHVRVTGTKNLDTICAIHDDICEASRRLGFSRLLVEERLDGPPLSTFDLYDVVDRASRHGARKYDAIAYVDESRNANLEFAETVAVNRGMAVVAFDSLDAARSWLREQA